MKLRSRLYLFMAIPIAIFVLLALFRQELALLVWTFTASTISIYMAKWIVVRRAAVPVAYLRATVVEVLIGTAGLLAFLFISLWPYYGA